MGRKQKSRGVLGFSVADALSHSEYMKKILDRVAEDIIVALV